MECNRDEAVRAKEIAERKLASQDYDGAHKFLQKALQLFPGLDNTAQMSAVLDVHIAAQAKINGTETDWYGILQVDPRAEDILIKKQYKKLALLLHPDKNKLSGAEAAFKLIGEALQVLSDKQQRSLHDSRRKHVSKNVSSVQRTQTRQPNAAPYMNRPSNTAPLTFVTICPACHTRFQYYRFYENHNVLCQHCHTPFIAREFLSGLDNGSYNAYSWSHQYPHHQQHFTNGSFQHYSTSSSFHTNPPPTYGSKTGDFTNKVSKESEDVNAVPGAKRKRNDETEKEKQRKAKADQKAQETMEKMKKKKKRQKRHSDSFSDDEDDITEESMENLSDDQLVNQAADSNAAPRRSSRPRRNVTYKVDESDDDEDRLAGTKVENKKTEKPEEGKSSNVSYSNAQSVSSVDVKANQKLANLVKVRIRQNLNLQNVKFPDKVPDKGSRSGINAGETKDKAEQNLTDQNVIKEDVSASDSVTMKNVRNPDMQHARNPDIQHATDVDAKKMKAGTDAKAKAKLSDAGTVLQKNCASTTLDECLAGKENCRKSSESLENSIKAKELNVDTDGSNKQREKFHANDDPKSNKKPSEDKESDREINEKKSVREINERKCKEDGLTVPDADFYNFDHEREEKDVAIGQIWAAYDDKEGLPRYYFKVKDVISRDPFEINITWLELRNISDEQRSLRDLGCYPVCGASFRGSSSQTLDSVHMFSHILTWEKGPKGAIKIFPKKGQIWAVFRGRKPGLRARKKNVYDMVEVLSDFNEQAGVSVVFLEKWSEYKTVFKRTKNYLDISVADICRFSYQVPAHKLQGTEAPGIQKGFWELDPASVPNDLIFSHPGVKSN